MVIVAYRKKGPTDKNFLSAYRLFVQKFLGKFNVLSLLSLAFIGHLTTLNLQTANFQLVNYFYTSRFILPQLIVLTTNMEVETTSVDKSTKKKFDNGARVVKKTRTELVSKEEREKRRRLKEAQRDYGRGKKVNVGGIKDKKLRSNLKSLENKYKEATVKAKDAEILLENTSGFLETEHELERTFKVRQDEIQGEVSIESVKKRFELKLDHLGPYVFEYSRTGRELLLGGRRGHVATMDWREGKLGCELQLGETVRDVQWLHNNQFFAVAQKKHVYIYDRQGVEVHCLRKHQEVTHMEFLPYHFLLATLVRMKNPSTHGLMSTDYCLRACLASLSTRTYRPANSWRKCRQNSGLRSPSLKILTTPSCILGTKMEPSHCGPRTPRSRW